MRTSNRHDRELRTRPWFPIPMRGNEKKQTADPESDLVEFPIPMKGNETWKWADVPVGEQPVSNPHEG